MKEKIIKQTRNDLDKSNYFFDGEIDQIISIFRNNLNKYIINETISKGELILKKLKNYYFKIKKYILIIYYEKIIKNVKEFKNNLNACINNFKNKLERNRKMNKLEMYKKLSNDDKSSLTVYSIYRSIYIIAKNLDKVIDDNSVQRICDLSYHLYLKDDSYNFSESRIADYLTNGYLDENISLDKMEEIDRFSIYEGIESDTYDIFFNEEKER